MNTKRTWVAFVLLIAMAFPCSAFAQDDTVSNNALSTEAMAFLEEHHVDNTLTTQMNFQNYSLSDEENAANSYDESILSLKRATDANGFNDEQIQAYVKGLVDNPTVVEAGEKTSMWAIDRPTDNGIGYEVRSQAGYSESTAYVTLPYTTRTDSSTYMFYTIDALNITGIDVGLWYNSGDGGEGWRGFYMADNRLVSAKTIIPQAQAGSSVYFDVNILSNGYARFRALNGNNFNDVYYDISYYIADRGINQTNACINRQVTLCNDQKNFKDGSSARNATFSDAYIYKPNGSYSKTLPSNTISNRVGIFGTNSINRNQVIVNSSIPWYQENVSIYFD